MTDSLDRRRFLKTVFGSALGIGGLGMLQACGGDSVSSDPLAPVPDARIAAAVAQLDPLVSALLGSSGVPGIAVAVVHGGKTLFAKGYGVGSTATGQPVDADTIFQLASVSKSIGATVVASQVGKGVVSWDTRMQQLMPSFALSDASVTQSLTVADLYAHRSGLPEHVGDQLEELGFDQATVFNRLREIPLTGYRSHYAYTNIGLTAAAIGVASAAGIDWATLSEQAVYAPLGMTRTSSRYADYLASANHAVGHVPVKGVFVPVAAPRDADLQSPAGGVSSSVNDLARWMAMVLANGRAGATQLIPAAALSPALSQQILIRPASAEGAAAYYGFGFNVGTTADGGRPMVSHSGGFLLGAGTFFVLVPSLDIGIAVLTNIWPVGVAEAIGFAFLDLVQYGAQQRDWPAFAKEQTAGLTAPAGTLAGAAAPVSPAPPQALTAYAGTYGNDYYGPMTVTVVDDALVLTIGPGNVSFACTHWDGDTFAISPSGEMAPPGSKYPLTFAGTPPTRVTAELFSDGGLNVFTR
ncbi:serine hydrolase [Burkholderia sp. BCC0419]|uniref:serine hydrolase n=1 Tax=Burkholderia sp. BCC0419 TaxID=486878 RepID=UPI0015889BEF|nr:serine hydrolase [Burkholderia sp. BCC0419]